MNKTSALLSKLFMGLLVYVPFHALISTFLISNFGHPTAIKSLKDLIALLIFMAVSLVFVLRSKYLSIKNQFALCLFTTVLVVNVLLISLFNKTPYEESLAGLLIFFRPLWVFFIGITLASLLKSKTYKNDTLKLVVICSSMVIVFGALQVLFLPKDFLAHFGYGVNTIMPYQTIDNNESFVRILSTLRGPNPLGAYLAMIAPLGIYLLSKIKSSKYLKALLYAVLFMITLYGAQSRSAWLGLAIGLSFYVFMINKDKKKIAKVSLFIILPVLLVGYGLRTSDLVQNIAFHRDPKESSSINSDNQRLSSLKFAINEINKKPFGHGVGSSGPASNYGNNPVIIENQYLDTAYQLGWIGLIAYIGVLISVGALLLRQKDNLSYALFSGLAAVSVIALFWPVWTDETIAITWWGLAGVMLSSYIVQKSKKQ